MLFQAYIRLKFYIYKHPKLLLSLMLRRIKDKNVFYFRLCKNKAVNPMLV